jgi:hypothetical protein
MYLSSRKTRVLSKVLLFLTEPGQEHEIRTRIGSLLLDLLDADYYASYVWAHDENRFGGRVAVNMSDSNLKSYEDYYQFHDPITPLCLGPRCSFRCGEACASVLRTFVPGMYCLPQRTSASRTSPRANPLGNTSKHDFLGARDS